ncbi:MAG: hypothetical protein A4S09_13960 [Proteobacteria bacterium SG_bin7]|nr:MAG: hypothetical protein A4S09_13960 [Proteobacteria bacterium SG_bin7]
MDQPNCPWFSLRYLAESSGKSVPSCLPFFGVFNSQQSFDFCSPPVTGNFGLYQVFASTSGAS